MDEQEVRQATQRYGSRTLESQFQISPVYHTPLPLKPHLCNVCCSEVRIGHTLSEAERQHVAKRRYKVQECLIKTGIHCPEDKVPNIAVLGSGGGLRAMISLLGSLSQLKEGALLDSIMYLCGVSGSTWCMASVYDKKDWSTNLETLNKNIIQRLAEGSVSWSAIGEKLVKYYNEKKDNFSLTDVWAAVIVSKMVKEINENKLSGQRNNYPKDPYPVYTVIDKQCKCENLLADSWFEITPDDSGYSLTGAYVDSTSFGSQFNNGQKIQHWPEMDMLYLQGLCGSALGDTEEIKKAIYEAIKHLIKGKIGCMEESRTPPEQKADKVLLALVDLNLCVLNGEDPTQYLKTLKELLKEKHPEAEECTLHVLKKVTSGEKISEEEAQKYTLCVCKIIIVSFEGGMWDVIKKAFQRIWGWTWGTTNNFIYNMKVKDVHPSVLQSQTRPYIDAGLLLNSPYFTALRKERHVDLIISLDFSSGDPFLTVKEAAKMCKERHIPFPNVVIPKEKTPLDFYVFEGSGDVPTVIHIPLFNIVNCNGEVEKWRERYSTSKWTYSREDITDLMEKAALNIKNNKKKLIQEIEKTISKNK
ncbi:cytosolic phospholipase A2 gamma-like [Hoplias malabaricus]|uniref:cytosolic phospholipase A2 gamma-like n=1 Tax=Hoplias malabaricus TaxID=27720 RepID=UPI003462D0E8